MNSKKSNIVFMGTPDFAVFSLKTLLENKYNIIAVVTSPDKPAGRGQKLQMSSVKQYALQNNLTILQPENLKDINFISTLKKMNPDLIIVVAFRMLPKEVWTLAPLGTINLHASLLPQYRGAAPINHAIINGEKETGITTFFIKEQIDTGNILFQEKVPIENDDNAESLHNKLAKIGAELLLKTIDAIEKNSFQSIPQATLITKDVLKTAPKIDKNFCRINWFKNGNDIYNFVRGLSPCPGAFTELINLSNNMVCCFKIYECSFEANIHNLPIPALVSDGKNYLKVAVSDGFICIKQIQQEGRKKLAITDFLRGCLNIRNMKIKT